jgi:hypothetical protein
LQQLPLQQNSPRPFPTTRPMEAEARDKHAKCGRTFNVSMLCFDIKQCDCCAGCIKPLHNDPQMARLASSSDHSFRRSHLVTKYYEDWFCDCQEFCRGGQYFGIREGKEIRMLIQKHGFDLAERWGDEENKRKDPFATHATKTLNDKVRLCVCLTDSRLASH